MTENTILKTEFKDLALARRGKVRDVYDLGDSLLIVSTDRISAFDVVLPSGIPDKGRVLNQLSCFWFDFLKDIVPHHIISADVTRYPQALQKYSSLLTGRSMLAVKARPFAVECVVRGYLSGSGWKEYKEKQSVCGIALPAGLRESDKLPAPIFTPSTKAEVGHDMNIDQAYVEKSVGRETADALRAFSIALYIKASEYALTKGIIIADTKFEFGLHNDRIILIDEALTPDSSRFWPKDQYSPGKSPPSFDKQFVRNYLESLSWNKTPPGPTLPEEIISKTSAKYRQAFQLLVGREVN